MALSPVCMGSDTDSGGFDVDTATLVSVDWALSIDGVTETVNNSSQKFFTNWHIDNGSGPLDGVTFFDVSVVTKHDNTDIVLLQVQSHTFQS